MCVYGSWPTSSALGNSRGDQFWDCKDNDVRFEPVCKQHERLLYIWNAGAPGLALPANSGFYLDPIYTHLVLQVHYKHQVTVGDFSGIGLRLSNVQPELELNSMRIYLDTEAHIVSFGKGKQGLASPNLTAKVTILPTLLVNFLPTCTLPQPSTDS